jgi:hypothetical protein
MSPVPEFLIVILQRRIESSFEVRHRNSTAGCRLSAAGRLY